MGKKGKCDFLQKILPRKKDKSDDDSPPVPPPPYGSYSHGYASANANAYSGSGYSYEDVCKPLKCPPKVLKIKDCSGPSNASANAFSGASGYHNMPADRICFSGNVAFQGSVNADGKGSPDEIRARLAMMNAATWRPTGFDFPPGSGNFKSDDSGKEKKKDGKGKDKKKKKKAKKQKVQFQKYIIMPPGSDESDESESDEGSSDDDDNGLKCRVENCESGKEVRKIKRVGDTPLCWDCVKECFRAGADFAWIGL